MTDLYRMLSIAHEAVDLAADLMRNREPGVVTAKGARDMVSELDVDIERQVKSFLDERSGAIGFLGEEEGPLERHYGMWWVLDPIDGTANFLRHLPMCGVSLGLVRDAEPLLGVVGLPFLNERYSALRGEGAHDISGAAIHAPKHASMSEAIVSVGDYAVGDNSETKNPLRLAITAQLAARAQRVRMFGSEAVDLCWVAAGRLDASIMLSNKPWDTAAGTIIAREAGAAVIDASGNPHTMRSTATIACSPALVNDILELIREASSGRGPDHVHSRRNGSVPDQLRQRSASPVPTDPPRHASSPAPETGA
jgi:myo-inositol-1(or 4)-monophosphatase